MRAALFIVALGAVLFAAPSWADMNSYQRNDYDQLTRPIGKAGRAIGNTFDRWSGEAEDATGFGNEAKESFLCSDPGFFVIRQEHGVSGAETFILKGALHVPMAGFGYRYMFLGQRGPEAFVQLQIGQAITPQYRERSATGSLQVMEKIALPPGVGLLHILVQGAAKQQQEIRCDVTGVKEPEPLPPEE